MLDSKTQAVMEWSQHRHMKDICDSLHLSGEYSECIWYYAPIVLSLHKMCKPSTKGKMRGSSHDTPLNDMCTMQYILNVEGKEAFHCLKNPWCKGSTLAQPG
jgi:hypothetical protein